MLTHLHIKNFIIVQSLSLDFQSGLHVLTGETGAGKSIWIDAIEIGLGARADAHLLYPGETIGEISVCFDLHNLPQAKEWLTDHDFAAEDECIIRRIIELNKTSRTTLNGTPIPQQLIREFAELILCIHGQHQHQQLLKPQEQMRLLDRYADNDPLLLQIQSDYNAWHQLQIELDLLQHQAKNKTADLTLWQYQLDELTALDLQENEYEPLFSQFQRLHQSKQFTEQLFSALACLDQDNAETANHLAQQSLQHLNRIHFEDKKLDEIRALLQTALIHLDEARDALQHYCSNTELDADQLIKIENRLTQLQEVARKHHVDPAQLHTLQQQLIEKIQVIAQSDEKIAVIQKEQRDIITRYQTISAELSQKRKIAAKKLSGLITQDMQQLGMDGGKFEIAFEPSSHTIHPNGNETIIFLIATNPGQTPHELKKTVSGGELSRLSLIIQVLTAEKKNTPTLIFDEVDVGIGGKTAGTVGKLLRELSKKAQVLCVTHLPQVAACGHHHFYAQKIKNKTSTTTTMQLLSEKERTQELARMLSGEKITEKSLQHAKELQDSVIHG